VSAIGGFATMHAESSLGHFYLIVGKPLRTMVFGWGLMTGVESESGKRFHPQNCESAYYGTL